MAHKLWDNLGPKLETVPNRDDQKKNQSMIHRDKIIGGVTSAKMIMPGGLTGSLFRIEQHFPGNLQSRSHHKNILSL